MSDDGMLQFINSLYRDIGENARKNIALPNALAQVDMHTEATRRALQQDEDVRNALSGVQSMDDVKGRLGQLIQADPKTAASLYNTLSTADSNALLRNTQALEAQDKLRKNAMEYGSRALAPLLDMSDAEAAQLYPIVAQDFIRNNPAFAGRVPAQWNRQFAQQIVGMAIDPNKRFEMANRTPTFHNIQQGDQNVSLMTGPGGQIQEVGRGPKFRQSPVDERKTEFETTIQGLEDKYLRDNPGEVMTPAKRLELLSQHKQNAKVDEAQALQEAKERGIDVQELAKAMGEGKLSTFQIKGTLRSPLLARVETETRKLWPKFDFAKADANVKWDQNQNNARTQSMIMGALPRVQALQEQVETLGNTSIPAINRVQAFTKTELGSPEYTNFMSNRNAIIQEINTALSGSATQSDMRVKIELENLKEARSPAQLHGSINNLNEALLSRMDSAKSPLWPIEVVRGDMSPQDYTKQLIKKYRGKYTPDDSGGSAKQPTSSPPITVFSGIPEGEPVRFKNGQVWMLQNGKPVRVEGQ